MAKGNNPASPVHHGTGASMYYFKSYRKVLGALLLATTFPGTTLAQPVNDAAIIAPVAPIGAAGLASATPVAGATKAAPPGILCDSFGMTTRTSNTKGMYAVELIFVPAQKVRPFSSPANVRNLVVTDDAYKWTRTSEYISDDDFGIVRTKTVLQNSANRRTGAYVTSGEVTISYTDPKGVAQTARGVGQGTGVCESEASDKPKF